LNRPALQGEDTNALARAMASEQQMESVRKDGTVDFAISQFNQRFRISVYRERGSIAMAVRLLPQHLLTLDEIGLPHSLRQLLDAPRGLILFTGPTGSGKTTSLASMIDVINATSSRHILTVEDPVEYLHQHKRGLVHQRELGTDVPSFSEGIRRSMRQDPDVILVGEMRDLETMEAAVTAAETGHLVFSTLHTTGATRTVDRIIDAFPPQQQEQVRVQLASTVRAVVSQLLLPRQDKKGRVAVFEVMINTPAVAALIRDNKTFRITTEIQIGAKHGMLSMEQSLADLHSRGIISYQDVMAFAQDVELAAQLAARKEK
jgi:twitching motility protein PilT